jgi:hypothetical protein
LYNRQYSLYPCSEFSALLTVPIQSIMHVPEWASVQIQGILRVPEWRLKRLWNRDRGSLRVPEWRVKRLWSRSAGIISRLKNTVGWFFVREKYCSGWKNKLNKTDYKPNEQGLWNRDRGSRQYLHLFGIINIKIYLYKIWSNLNLFDSLESENAIFWMDGVHFKEGALS